MERAHKISRATLFVLVLVIALCFSIHKIESRDFGWLLKTGQHIYETCQAPHAELFSFTAQGNKYIDSHWLFQLLLYISYLMGGIVGTTLFAAGIVTATFGVVYLIAYDREKYAVASVFVLAGIVMASGRFLPRPHLITIFFLSIYFFILERHSRRGGRLILLLPCFQLLWVNMHGLFVLGLVLPALYLACGLFEMKIGLPWVAKQIDGGPRRNDLILLGAVLAGMVFESLLSPYTLDVALYPLTLFREVQSGANVVAGSVAELAPTLRGTDLSRAVRYFRWMVYLLPVTFILNWRRANPAHIVLFAAFFYLALIARRNLDLFAVIAMPIAARNIAGFLDELPRYFKRTVLSRVGGFIQPAVSGLIILGMFYMIFLITTDRYFIRDRDLTRFGFGVAMEAHPIKAANFVEAANLGGEMFNDPSVGGYLIWRFFPERRVYFDGRWEVYGERFLENFKKVCSDPSLFDSQADVAGIEYALLTHSLGHLSRLIKHMLESPDWALVYFDEISMVFAKNTADNAETIERFAIDPATFEAVRDEYVASLPDDIGESHYSGTDSMLARLTERIPRLEYPFEELARANFYFDYGYYDSARTLYEEALRVYPDSEIARGRLGRIYAKQK